MSLGLAVHVRQYFALPNVLLQQAVCAFRTNGEIVSQEREQDALFDREMDLYGGADVANRGGHGVGGGRGAIQRRFCYRARVPQQFADTRVLPKNPPHSTAGACGSCGALYARAR